MPTPTEPKNVVIVGGSLAALMHALTLLTLPSPPLIRILERTSETLFHNQGAGIVAGNEVQEFFGKYMRVSRDIAVTSPRRHYLDRNGNVIVGSVQEWSQRMTSWDLLYRLLRWRVTGETSECVAGLKEDERPRAKYEHGCTVTSVEDVGEKGVKVVWTRQNSEKSEEATADLLVAADGASSAVRGILAPNVKREYAGYVAWRGTCPETALSTNARESLVERFTFFHTDGMQILGYLIPGENGTLETGERLFNWVWYCNYAIDSLEFHELMTDVDGKRHAVTLPVGKTRPQIWEKHKAFAAEVLPPQFAEAVVKTKQPFVQAITDVLSRENSFLGGKVLVVGDALAGFRPHTAASTGQAAFDALALGKLMDGRINGQQYDETVREFARRVQKHGVMLGERSQFGRHPLAD